MATPNNSQIGRPSGRKSIAAVVGTGAAAILLSVVPKFEGVILRGYKDPIGIVTACAGHTKTAKLGVAYTPAQCTAMLDADLVEHAEGVLACTPELKGRTYQLAAATSFAFNVGIGAYCGSTMAKLNRLGDYAGACRQLPRWVNAGGRVLPGLVTRRASEMEICFTGLAK